MTNVVEFPNKWKEKVDVLKERANIFAVITVDDENFNFLLSSTEENNKAEDGMALIGALEMLKRQVVEMYDTATREVNDDEEPN